MSFVLDCSMTLAWILPDEKTPRTDQLRDSLVERTGVVPSLWPVEVASVLLVATRHGRIEEQMWSVLVQQIGSLPIETDPETERRALTDALGLAYEHGLSAYDATYLELAIRRRLPLATLDGDLAGAARRAGVEVL